MAEENEIFFPPSKAYASGIEYSSYSPSTKKRLSKFDFTPITVTDSPLSFKHSRSSNIEEATFVFSKKSKSKNAETHVVKKKKNEICPKLYHQTRKCLSKIPKLKPKTEKEKAFSVPVQNKNHGKKIAVFDLDETLVHCIGEVDENTTETYDRKIEVNLPLGKKKTIGINIRPHVEKALRKIKQYYSIYIFTASHHLYADAVLKVIDERGELFDGVFYRNHCVQRKLENETVFVKDLDIFEKFPLEDVVIIDNCVLSFAFHLSNGIPISPFYDSRTDKELLALSNYLVGIKDWKDLRIANDKYIGLTEMIKKRRKNDEKRVHFLL